MITEFTLQNFRNIENIKTNCAPLNIFVGDNGAGKTSILEAIYFMAYVKSFRVSQQDNLIKWDNPYCLVSFSLLKPDEKITLYKQIQQKTEIKIQKQPTESRLKSKKFLNQNIAAAVISPHIDSLITGESLMRRNWLDNIMFHMEHSTKKLWQEYNYVLENRNRLLKRKNYTDDEFWLHKIADCGNNLQKARKSCFDLYQIEAKKWLNLAGLQDVYIELFAGWDENQEPLNLYYKSITLDRANGFTKIGAHRADINIYWQKDKTAKKYASRGQAKLINTVLLVAQLEFLKNYVSSPILLLDDITAELDSKNLQILMERLLPETQLQTFITAIEYNNECFIQAKNNDSIVNNMSNGKII